MIQAYSNGLSVAAETAIPFNNVPVQKGETAVLSGNSTFNLNKCGVYDVCLDAFCEAGAVGDIVIQMVKNGVARNDAISTATGATGDNDTLSFHTLVQVPRNNCGCLCSEPVTIQFMNNGVAVTGLHVNVVITKLV